MKEVDVKTLFEMLESRESTEEAKIILAIKNENDEIVKAYEKQKELLTELSDSLKKVAYYFYCIHTMTRITLCNGK